MSQYIQVSSLGAGKFGWPAGELLIYLDSAERTLCSHERATRTCNKSDQPDPGSASIGREPVHPGVVTGRQQVRLACI